MKLAKAVILENRNELLRQAKRTQYLFLSALLYKGPEKEYLGLIQGLADAYCELKIIEEKLNEETLKRLSDKNSKLSFTGYRSINTINSKKTRGE